MAEAVREGRRAEFKSFSAFQDPVRRAAIPDPNAPGTFDASIPDRPDPAMFEMVQHLLALRREHIVPGLPGCRSLEASVLMSGAVRASWLLGTGRTLTITINLGQTGLPLPGGDLLFAYPGAGMPPGSIAVQVSTA